MLESSSPLPPKDIVSTLLKVSNSTLAPAALAMLAWLGGSILEIKSDILLMKGDMSQIKVHITEGVERNLIEQDRRITHLEEKAYDYNGSAVGSRRSK